MVDLSLHGGHALDIGFRAGAGSRATCRVRRHHRVIKRKCDLQMGSELSPNNIANSFDSEIDAFFGLERFGLSHRHKEACVRVYAEPPLLDGADLVRRLDRIALNGSSLESGRSARESELWRWRKNLALSLATFVDVRSRDQFALDALKVGVVALRQSRGHIDADRLKSEGEHLLESLKASLESYQRQAGQELSAGLKEYFDPKSGRLAERLERLVRRDGELEQVLRRHVGGDSSELAQTLAVHLGKGSVLASLFDPSSSNGFLPTLTQNLHEQFSTQRERIIGEFSLDNDDGALSRLVAELSERHGEPGQALEKRIDEVVAEFSLDREDSALSRCSYAWNALKTKSAVSFPSIRSSPLLLGSAGSC
jgi:hypothetical protein